MPENRWAAFTDRELNFIWQAVITPFVDPAFEDLVAELEDEQAKRDPVGFVAGRDT